MMVHFFVISHQRTVVFPYKQMLRVIKPEGNSLFQDLALNDCRDLLRVNARLLFLLEITYDPELTEERKKEIIAQ